MQVAGNDIVSTAGPRLCIHEAVYVIVPGGIVLIGAQILFDTHPAESWLGRERTKEGRSPSQRAALNS